MNQFDETGSSLRTLFCFDSYFLDITVSEDEITHVLQVLENENLDGSVRRAAAAQFVTFLVSDRRTASIVREKNAFSSILSMVRGLLHTQNIVLYNQLCECLCVLLLVSSVSHIAEAHGGWISEVIFDHRSSIMGSILPRVFHKNKETRLRSLQLLAVLVFDKAFLYQGQFPPSQDAVSEKTTYLVVPSWFEEKYQLPVAVRIVDPVLTVIFT